METLLGVIGFTIKSGIVVLSIVVVIAFLIKQTKEKVVHDGKLSVKRLSTKLLGYTKSFDEAMLSSEQFKEKWKGAKPVEKPNKLYILDFDGNVTADDVVLLREEITAILTIAKESDEVLVKVNSGGGTVDGYGLVAAQIERLKSAGLKVTVSVDRIAASGGYMSAVVADTVIAAPFSYIGSIGVVGQIPNFYKLLNEKGITFEQHTAGKYKRTLTSVTEATDEDREKFKEDLERMHKLFKEHISKFRPNVDLEKVATGEVWNGTDALEVGLIDKVQVSDDFLSEKSASFELLEVTYEPPKDPSGFIQSVVSQSISKPLSKLLESKILA